MKYWIVAITRADLEQCLKLGKYGRNSDCLIKKASEGDKLVFFATGERKIIALGEVVRPCYRDYSKVFRATQQLIEEFGDDFPGIYYYPHRIDFTHEMLSPPVDLAPLVRDMDFIKNPEYPHASYRRGFADITERDWDTISKAIHKTSSSAKSTGKKPHSKSV